MLRQALATLSTYAVLVYLGAAWFSWCMFRGKGGK